MKRMHSQLTDGYLAMSRCVVLRLPEDSQEVSCMSLAVCASRIAVFTSRAQLVYPLANHRQDDEIGCTALLLSELSKDS